MDNSILKTECERETERAKAVAYADAACQWIIFETDAPAEIKSIAAGLMASTAINGYPVCSKAHKDKLDPWFDRYEKRGEQVG